MARAVNWDVLRELAGFAAEKGCAISLYLDLDPSVTPTAGDVATRLRSLLSEGERSYADKLDTLSHDQKLGFKADFARIDSYFTNEFDRDGTQGVAVFAAGLDGAWTVLPLARSVPDKVCVGRRFHLAPLVPLVGRGEGAIVAVVSRERGNLYRLAGGRLEEIENLTEHQPRRHDQGGLSQGKHQRRIDNLAEQHVEEVAEELDRRLREAKTAKAVVVAGEEFRSNIESHLTQETRERVVGWAQAEAHASPNDLLAVVQPLLEQARDALERSALERWREEAGKGARAASGWEHTLEAASDARVEVLLFANGVVRKGWQCPQCSRVSAQAGNCPLDGIRMEEHDDALDLAVHQVIAHGGTVWSVDDRQDLDPVEGIGALLRF
jgi:peptide chain release factor subunit 1